jgi:hypothetical protein
MFTKQSINDELHRITKSVPEALRLNTFKEVEKTPSMKLVFEKALEDPNISDDKKEKIKHLLESGTLSKTKITENAKIAKMRDDWVNREIRKSVLAGRLPTKKKFKELGFDIL